MRAPRLKRVMQFIVREPHIIAVRYSNNPNWQTGPRYLNMSEDE